MDENDEIWKHFQVIAVCCKTLKCSKLSQKKCRHQVTLLHGMSQCYIKAVKKNTSVDLILLRYDFKNILAWTIILDKSVKRIDFQNKK